MGNEDNPDYRLIADDSKQAELKSGLIDIGLLWVAILLTIRYSFKISKVAGLRLLPYMFWVSFAVVLNLALWILNT